MTSVFGDESYDEAQRVFAVAAIVGLIGNGTSLFMHGLT
jgi:hypothetical protein